MRAILFSFLLLFLSTITLSQNVLEIRNTKSGKVRMLKQGARLQFKTIHDSTFIKAKIVMIKDSIITFYIPEFDDESPLMDVSVNHLKEVQKASTFHAISRGVASVTLPVGTFLFFNGGISLLRDSNEDKTKTAVFTGSGLGLAVVSLIPYLIKPNTYKTSDGWVFKMGQKK